MNIQEVKLNPKCSVCKTYWKPDETDILPSGVHAKSCKKCRNRQKETRLKNKCEHGRLKYYCKECGGSQICDHNKRKEECKVCVGSQICEHNKRKKNCKDCKGSQICEHNKHKSACRKCNFELYLINLQRVQIYRVFKNSSQTKKKQSIEYLGLNSDEFIKFFQKKINL